MAVVLVVSIVRKVAQSEWDCSLTKKKEKLATVSVGHFSLEKRRLKRKKLATVSVGHFSLEKRRPKNE